MHFADDPETQVSGSSDVEGGDVSTAGQSYTKQAASDMLHGIVTSLMEFYDSSPAEFHDAVEAAHRNVQRLQTASSVVSALHNFAKTPGTMALSVRGRNRAAIPVQPTALARRKSAFGGRRCAISGRPPKRCFVTEHGYSDSRQGTETKMCALELPRKIAKKPHSLTSCVTANCSRSK